MDNFAQSTEKDLSQTHPLLLFGQRLRTVTIISFIAALLLTGILLISFSKLTQQTPHQQGTILQPSPSPITAPSPASSGVVSNWKTYRNKEYKYEIKYPPDWKKEDSYIEPDAVAFSDSQLYGDVRVTYALFSIFSRNYSDETIEILKKNLKPESGKLKRIGSQQALEQAISDLSGSEETKQYSFISSNTFYTIQTRILDTGTFKSSTRTHSDYRKLFDQILSTFRFVE